MAKYDLVIIGSGPGGYVAAIRASQWGLKTAVVEKDPFLGGTCLHVGCIPTKVFLHHADIYDYFQRAEEFGFEVKDVKVNWPAMLARKDKIVKKHAGGIGLLFKKNKVDSITGWGRIAGPGPRVRRERRQDHRDRDHLHDDRDRLGGALASRRGNRRAGDPDEPRNFAAPGNSEIAGGGRLRAPWASNSPRFSGPSAPT